MSTSYCYTVTLCIRNAFAVKADGQTDMQMDRQMDRQIDRQMNR